MEFQNDIATLPLPLLPTKTMVQFVMEAIKQVPLVSLTDVTRQVASFYPVPLTTVSSISSTFHSTLSNCQEEANLTSPPLNTIKTTFNLTPPPPPSSPPFSFPFASHPLLVNTVTNESTLQTILSTTDPTVQHKILSLIQQAHSSTPWKQKKQNSSTSFSSNMDSLSSSILRTKIHENSTKQNHPHELHQK
ncbi:hypothetical protein HMI54_005832 [Coelomomyces lativittatus]|nr:hypothetical protein HMI55_002648 [Coelomomyces lativittatus]KAJ1505594.1 hypothetical protein HMI54_005832 [Coelomomyces lativittatus]KAJ1511449.1 hypothetical protein HMI56_005380 [Coelomomyces lativittatus]